MAELILRQRETGKAYCDRNECGEPIEWAPERERWVHVRTGLVACSPRCDVLDCPDRVAQIYGSDVWQGYVFVFKASLRLCATHAAIFNRANMTIERT